MPASAAPGSTPSTKLPVYTAMNVLVSAGAGLRRRTVELPACVVRTGPRGVAVEWRDMGVATLVDLLQQAWEPADWIP